MLKHSTYKFIDAILFFFLLLLLFLLAFYFENEKENYNKKLIHSMMKASFIEKK